MHTEADLLDAMEYATLPEQRRLMAELQDVRDRKTASKQAARDTDLGARIARDHLTPVLVHGQHTASTDWLDEVAPNYHTADLKNIDREIRAEAATWFSHVHQAVREDQEEFGEQARGVARRTASQYGTLQNQVANLFISHIASLYRLAEGTDMAGVPSAAGDNTNPDLEPWKTETTLPPNNADTLSAPPGLDASPEQPSPEGGSLDGEPSDSSPTSAPSVDADNLLDVSDSNNAAGSTQSGVAVQTMGSRRVASIPEGIPKSEWPIDDEGHPFYPNGKMNSQCPACEAAGKNTYKNSYLDKPSVWSEASRHFLALEEGQALEIPGQTDVEQSGEAGTTLPQAINPTDAPETMDNFIDFNKDDPSAVSSERAKNISANGYKAHCGRTDEHGAHMADGKFCVGNKGDRITEKTKKDASLEALWASDPFRVTAGDQPPWLKKDDDNADKDKDNDDTDDDEKTPSTGKSEDSLDDRFWGDKDDDDSKKSSKLAISTGPNPQGSFAYDPARVTDLGYKEGFRYAVLWSPGKPVPAAISSSAGIGDKYNAQYVAGYKEGVAAGIAKLPTAFKAAWVQASANPVQVAASRRTAAEVAKPGHWEDGEYVNEAGGQEVDEDEYRKKNNLPKSAALPQLELSAMDDTVSNPLTLSEGGGNVDGKGAADVASVPTPGQSEADYPQPSGTPAPAIGTQPIDAWVGGGTSDPEKTAAFRAIVSRNLARV
jgi:hypothetical protein